MTEANVRNFSGDWTGTGSISGAGDAETICLDSGEYMESPIVDTGDYRIWLGQNIYDITGDDVIMKYRTGATPNACAEADWTLYIAPFNSLGYTQVRLESSDLGLLEVGATDRYLVDQSATPVLLVGDTAWSAINQLTTAEMDTYLEDRVGRGFNIVIVDLLEHYFSTNAPNNIYDDPPFTGANFTTPNEDYFTHADYFIEKANALGLYVLLYPLYLGATGTEEGWDSEVTAASTDDMIAWGEYVGNRYKDYNHIIWVIGCDRIATAFLTKINAFIDGLNNYDTKHLITFHDVRGTMGIDNLAGASWCVLNNIYTTYLATPAKCDTAYAVSPTMPFFQIEAWYENDHSMTAQQLRAQAYWTVLGGGCGHIFGNTPLWNFAYAGGDWEAELDDAGSIGMTHFGALLNAVDWHTLIPDSAHGLLTSGYGTQGNDDFAGAAINAAGTLALIYMPSNRTMSVDMSDFAGTVTCRWYDPTSGQYEVDAASPHANSGSHDFSHAGTNDDGDADWVLVLEA